MRNIKKQKIILLILLIAVVIISFVYLNHYNFFQKDLIKIDKQLFQKFNSFSLLELEIDLYINENAEIEFIWINLFSNEMNQVNIIKPYVDYLSIGHFKKDRSKYYYIQEIRNFIKIKKISLKENYNNWYRLSVKPNRQGNLSYSYTTLIIPENDIMKYNLIIDVSGGCLSHHSRSINYSYEKNIGELIHNFEDMSKKVLQQELVYSNEISDYIIHQLRNYDFLNLETPTRSSNNIKTGEDRGTFKIVTVGNNEQVVEKEFYIPGYFWNEYNFSQCFHFLFNFAQYNTISEDESNE